MDLAIVLHSQCNASCTHCSRSFGPRREEKLARTDIFRLMEEAAAVDDGTPLRFDLTGGEPFMHFDLLTDVVAHGTRLGGVVTCVTNAYWARTREMAQERLRVLREAGLAALAVSASRFHQEFVPLHRVRWTLEACAALGIRSELKAAVTMSDLTPGGTLDRWKRTLDADQVNLFPVFAQLRQGAFLPESEYYREPGLPEQKCPGEALCIDFDGVATSCAAPATDDGFLVVGNVHTTPLSEIQRAFRMRGRQRILRESGPVAFARAAITAGQGHRLRDSYAGPCDLCLHIRAQPELRRIAEELSAKADAGHL